MTLGTKFFTSGPTLRHASASDRMTGLRTKQAMTRVARHVRARRHEVYKALVDRDLVAVWLAPGSMRCVIHEFEPREGGRIRMSLIYEHSADGPGGKTTEDTDTFHGHFVRLVPDERVVQLVEFESRQPGMSGQMRVTWELADAAEGTNVTVVCEDIPRGIRLEDNEAGSASSLEKLAQLVEKPDDRGPRNARRDRPIHGSGRGHNATR